jgi:predicted 2-oxoglutarate/Fe(II)-dependent dioxygenase YbiX
MSDKLSDYVMVGNVFTPEQCQWYIEKLNQHKWQPHRWFQNDTSEYVYRKDFDTTYDSELQNTMKDPILKFVYKYYDDHREPGDTSAYYSGIRFNRYNEGESIKLHIDHIHSLFDGKKRGIPVLSFVGVFNDDYEGGEFMLCNEEIKLKQGDCIVFPSVFLYPHEVKPVTKGTRYSWVMWSW